MHTDIKPENVAVVLERGDYPEHRHIGSLLDQKLRHSLFTLEVSLLNAVFNKIIRKEPLYELVNNPKKSPTKLVEFLEYAVTNKSIIKLLQPPFRARVLEACKETVMADAKWVEPVELELLVYVSSRSEKEFEQFLEKFWKEEDTFLNDLELVDEIYTKLASRVGKCATSSVNCQIILEVSEIALILCKQPLFNDKSDLKKHSHQEFFRKKKGPKLQGNILSNKLSLSKLDLSKRKFKIIDYGNCYSDSEKRFGVISTRQFRAPEVILSRSTSIKREIVGNRRPHELVRENGHLVAGLFDF